jgi:hypothetical protein
MMMSCRRNKITYAHWKNNRSCCHVVREIHGSEDVIDVGKEVVIGEVLVGVSGSVPGKEASSRTASLPKILISFLS